jgi:hypothetical protein
MIIALGFFGAEGDKGRRLTYSQKGTNFLTKMVDIFDRGDKRYREGANNVSAGIVESTVPPNFRVHFYTVFIHTCSLRNGLCKKGRLPLNPITSSSSGRIKSLS